MSADNKKYLAKLTGYTRRRDTLRFSRNDLEELGFSRNDLEELGLSRNALGRGLGLG